MKKLLFLSAFVLLSALTQAQNVNIPDAIFKSYLVNNVSINTNKDMEIQTSEASAFSGSIECYNIGIKDLTGIEAFTALTLLNCNNNPLTSLNVSSNTALTYLDCNACTKLTSLNVSGAAALTYLDCSSCKLTSLNLSDNTALTNLNCSQNVLMSLNVSNNTALKRLNCYSTQLTSLNLSANTALTQLYCESNQLSSLNLSANTALTDLECRFNQLTSLNVSANNALTNLNCFSNKLASLDVSINTALTNLNLNYNQLNSLDVSANTALKGLYCYGNLLTSLNLSANSALIELDCNSNQLNQLNIKNGNNLKLSFFNAINNPNLTCIEVDDVAYSISNLRNKDNTASFSVDCSSTAVIYRPTENKIIAVYPNPTKNYIDFSVHTNVQIFNVMSQLIAEKKNVNTLDLSAQPTGIYFITLTDNNGQVIQRSKIVKE